MAAPKKNEFWKLRSKHGRDKLFSSPEKLWEAACEFFAWIEANPLKEEKIFQYQGEVVRADVKKMRAMTWDRLCFYLHCNEAYFRQFKAALPEGEKDYSTVIEAIEQIMRAQKFEGAAADLLNANIISRDLGLMDKQQVDLNTDLSKLNEEQLIFISNAIIKKQLNDGKGKTE